MFQRLTEPHPKKGFPVIRLNKAPNICLCLEEVIDPYQNDIRSGATADKQKSHPCHSPTYFLSGGIPDVISGYEDALECIEQICFNGGDYQTMIIGIKQALLRLNNSQ